MSFKLKNLLELNTIKQYKGNYEQLSETFKIEEVKLPLKVSPKN